MRLISMVDYVLEQDETFIPTRTYKENVINYANFLKQPLELWMFVPCDEDGNVLKELKNYKQWERKALNTPYDLDLIKYEQYQQAKERCFFEGFFNTTEAPQYKMYIQNGMQSVFYIDRNSNTIKNIYGMKKIEDLISETPVRLTQTAIKQIS